MNDFEHEIRDTLRRHEDDAPTFDASDAQRVAGRTRHRQIVNVASVGIGTLIVAIGLVVGLGGLVRADRPPTVLDKPLPSQACGATRASVGTPGPNDAAVQPWPDRDSNPAGVYSWDGVHASVYRGEGVMHTGHSRRPGGVFIFIKAPGSGTGVPGRLIPHRGRCAVVAGHEGTYRRFNDGQSEEWMVDILGTTMTITLTVRPRTPETDVAEAHEIIRSIYVDPVEYTDFGFRLIFTIPSNAWDSG